MSVDWYAAGDQTIIFERSCAKAEVVPEEQCFEGGNAIDQPLFKDCKITCDSDNCNNEESTEAVEMLYSDLDENGEPKEIYCYEYSMNDVPADEGTMVDYNQLSNIDWYVRKCPVFANNGCFRGNLTVRATGLAINSMNKGCSMFKFDQIGTQCEDRVQSEVCKSYCTGDFCNKGGLSSGDDSRPPIMCHQCLEIRDHMGQIIPNQPRNDENCHDLINNDYLGYCRGDHTHCANILKTDWFLGGYQILFHERMCSYDEPADVCESANSGIVIFKDCNTTCSGSDGCNDGNDVELLFSATDESGNPKDMSCYAYRSDTRDGEKQPLPDGSYDGVDDLIMQCPRFANQGCFKADYELAEDGAEVFPTGFHKGCSMFELEDRETECQENPFLGTICREHCTDPECNQGYINPPDNNDSTTEATTMTTMSTTPSQEIIFINLIILLINVLI
jgi:hypothetical protein